MDDGHPDNLQTLADSSLLTGSVQTQALSTLYERMRVPTKRRNHVPRIDDLESRQMSIDDLVRSR